MSTPNPCKVAIDFSNNDLYASNWNGAIHKYTAASGYSGEQWSPGGGGNDRLTVNGAKDILYVAHSSVVVAYSTSTGELLEEVKITGKNFRGVAVNEENDTLYVYSSNAQRVLEIRLSVVPKAETGEPISNKTVSGTVAPDGAGEITECYFEFGLTTSYKKLGGMHAGCSHHRGNGRGS